ncbi:hypothetical protein BRCON_0318 [Candidatus Sumerlaea chitinivorans]|uniref:Uncharacterized protein n=1 Tax=Sumerlaea chitinivorans TaxID=2250252 RepID=A0A2Z4Y3Q8_SUMC1|nr:hypothetical protein BRCON_0318 [Candidatus Sumerlaea chitinivorans]
MTPFLFQEQMGGGGAVGAKLNSLRKKCHLRYEKSTSSLLKNLRSRFCHETLKPSKTHLCVASAFVTKGTEAHSKLCEKRI